MTPTPEPPHTTGIPDGVLASQCPECSDGEGKVSADFLKDASCLFGCGRKVPNGEHGAGFCATCDDHSQNEIACATCGFTYRQTEDGQWAKEWTR